MIQELTEEQPTDKRTSARRLVVGSDHAGERLDRFVQRELGDVPRSRVMRVIRKGEVRVNGGRARPETRLAATDEIRIPPVREPPATPVAPRPAEGLLARIAAAVIHEDPEIIVLDKPAGLAVHGGSGTSFGIIEGLRILRPEETLELAHRLDRDTSGCLVVARSARVLRELHALLRGEGFEKRYLALVRGRWELGRKRIDAPLRTDLRVGGERTVRTDAGGKPSVSDFRPVQFLGAVATLVEVGLETGRTHQIRVHAVHAGHPVAGDAKYGDPEFNRELAARGLKRMFLHAHSVSFQLGGRQLSFNAPLPADLAQVIDELAMARRGGRSHPRRGQGMR